MKKAESKLTLLQELKHDLLHKAIPLPNPQTPRFWRRGGSRPLDQPPECVVCLQVHQVTGLPLPLEGRSLMVGWRTKGWAGELTAPVTACGGAAVFDDIFLHCCSGGVTRLFVWVSLVDAGDCDLGTFGIDVGDLVGDHGLKFGGKGMRFELCGVGKGGELSASVYYRMVDAEFFGSSKQGRSGDSFDAEEEEDQRGSKCKCFPCVSNPKHRRNRQLAISGRRIRSHRSDSGFITMEDFSLQLRSGDSGFITMEKGTICAPPSNTTSLDTEDKDGDDDVDDNDNEESDVQRIEIEFLRMLEGKQEEEEEEVGVVGGGRTRKSRAGGATLEREEYEELLKRWGSMNRLSSADRTGFGSPV